MCHDIIFLKYITAEHIFPAYTRTPNETTQIKSTKAANLANIEHFYDYTTRTTGHNFTGNGDNQKDIGSKNNKTSYREDVCGHIVTTYILPSLTHLIAYLLGFFYFRINENEQLYALMEKVFLAVNQKFKTDSQDKVIRRLKY